MLETKPTTPTLPNNQDLVEFFEANKKVNAVEIIFKFYFYERLLDKIKRLKLQWGQGKYLESDNYYKIKSEIEKLDKLQTKAEKELQEVWKFIKTFILAVIFRELEYSTEIRTIRKPNTFDGPNVPHLKLKDFLESKNKDEIVKFLELAGNIFIGPSFVPKVDAYGGEPWKKISDFAVQVWRSENMRTDLIDLFFDIEHNNGSVFKSDRWTQIQVAEYGGDIKQALNIKFEAEDIDELITNFSDKKYNAKGADWNSGSDELGLPCVSKTILENAKSELQIITKISKVIK